MDVPQTTPSFWFRETMLNRDTRRPPKVYTNMPKEFDGAIGDKIVGWLEKFEES
jgi:hypothetical protein